MTSPLLAVDLLLNTPPAVGERRWSGRDTAIYNLGIGFGTAAAIDERQLSFVQEECARAFPTMISVLHAQTASLFDPRFNVDFAAVVHGEEAIELYRPLAGEGELRSRRHVVAIWDKGQGKGAVMRVCHEFTDKETGEPVATVYSTYMLRGNGGFGGSNEGAPKPLFSPDRLEDGYVDMSTLPEQAMLYRLAGDRNPLHVDPAVARQAGFAKPILMGLCSFGIAGRAMVSAFADGEAERLTALSVRFTGIVFPGETLRFEHWRLTDGQIAFRATVLERGTVVLDGGRARIAG